MCLGKGTDVGGWEVFSLSYLDGRRCRVEVENIKKR